MQTSAAPPACPQHCLHKAGVSQECGPYACACVTVFSCCAYAMWQPASKLRTRDCLNASQRSTNGQPAGYMRIRLAVQGTSGPPFSPSPSTQPPFKNNAAKHTREEETDVWNAFGNTGVQKRPRPENIPATPSAPSHVAPKHAGPKPMSYKLRPSKATFKTCADVFVAIYYIFPK